MSTFVLPIINYLFHVVYLRVKSKMTKFIHVILYLYIFMFVYRWDKYKYKIIMSFSWSVIVYLYLYEQPLLSDIVLLVIVSIEFNEGEWLRKPVVVIRGIIESSWTLSGLGSSSVKKFIIKLKFELDRILNLKIETRLIKIWYVWTRLNNSNRLYQIFIKTLNVIGLALVRQINIETMYKYLIFTYTYIYNI